MRSVDSWFSKQQERMQRVYCASQWFIISIPQQEPKNNSSNKAAWYRICVSTSNLSKRAGPQAAVHFQLPCWWVCLRVTNTLHLCDFGPALFRPWHLTCTAYIWCKSLLWIYGLRFSSLAVTMGYGLHFVSCLLTSLFWWDDATFYPSFWLRCSTLSERAVPWSEHWLHNLQCHNHIVARILLMLLPHTSYLLQHCCTSLLLWALISWVPLYCRC